MGGMALRAPVLAALFLIVTLATLAMPGSANFIGEFYILTGALPGEDRLRLVAISGVALAAFYALRLYQRTMHNRPPDGIESREITAARGVGARAAGRSASSRLALYPQLVLKRPTRGAGRRGTQPELPVDEAPATAEVARR